MLLCTRRLDCCIHTMPAIVFSVRDVRLLRVAALTAICCLLSPAAEAETGWTVTRNPHFEIFSQAGETAGRQALNQFEHLRAFFQSMGLEPGNRAAVRVIGFRSPAEYDAYRLRPAADAYFVG